MGCSFFVKDALGALETPGGKSKPAEMVETPLTDVINRHLKVSLANRNRNGVSHSDMQAITASPKFTRATEEVNPIVVVQGKVNM